MPNLRFPTYPLILLLLAAAACRGGFHTAEADPVVVHPSAVTLDAGSVQVFAATVAGTADTAVTWTVREGPSGGSIDSAGDYTAPAAAGTYHVVATSVANPVLAGTATATVLPPPVAVAITPSTISLSGCAATTFTATVSNAANTAVTWSVQEGATGGTIDAAGNYVAPAAPGAYHVVATSHADTTKSAVAAVTVSTQVLGVSVNPGATSILVGGTLQFTATVTTTCGQFTATQAVAMRR